MILPLSGSLGTVSKETSLLGKDRENTNRRILEIAGYLEESEVEILERNAKGSFRKKSE